MSVLSSTPLRRTVYSRQQQLPLNSRSAQQRQGPVQPGSGLSSKRPLVELAVDEKNAPLEKLPVKIKFLCGMKPIELVHTLLYSLYRNL